MGKKLRQYISQIIYESFDNRQVDRNVIADKLYHVTTNKKAVLTSGVLLAKKGFDSGGLGGTESLGISFVQDKQIALTIFNELNLINNINSSNSEQEVLDVLHDIQDIDRKSFVLDAYKQTIDTYQSPIITAIMTLRLSRNSTEFSNKNFYGLIIFNERNIKHKDIGIITIDKNQIPKDVMIVQGVDTDLGEIRVLGDIKL